MFQLFSNVYLSKETLLMGWLISFRVHTKWAMFSIIHVFLFPLVLHDSKKHIFCIFLAPIRNVGLSKKTNKINCIRLPKCNPNKGWNNLMFLRKNDFSNSKYLSSCYVFKTLFTFSNSKKLLYLINQLENDLFCMTYTINPSHIMQP